MQQYFQLQLRENTVIGAGSVVTKKCDKNILYILETLQKRNDILN